MLIGGLGLLGYGLLTTLFDECSNRHLHIIFLSHSYSTLGETHLRSVKPYIVLLNEI